MEIKIYADEDLKEALTEIDNIASELLTTEGTDIINLLFVFDY